MSVIRLASYLLMILPTCMAYTDKKPKEVLQVLPVQYYVGDSANVSRLLDSLLHGYDNRLRPDYKSAPVEVGITMFVSSVSSISEVDMDYTLDMYFRQHWRDNRLAFNESEEELCISNEMLAKIWWPDTFFANAKDAKFHHATTKNAFLRIKPTGQILQSLRLTVTAMCNMDLTFFPMDNQVCSLEIESYGYSVKDIKYTWKDGLEKSVGVAKDVQLPTFKVIGYRVKERNIELSTGNYSRLGCELYFGRSLGYYIIHIYVPSCLIVVLSWVSFWLSRDAVPARVALGITTVLTMTTLVSSTNASLPKISYLKSIDVYLVTCFVMVFASLLEYALVSYLSNRENRLKKRRVSDPQVNGFGDVPDHFQTEVRLTSMKNMGTECDLKSLPSHPCLRMSRSHTPEDAPSISPAERCTPKPSTIDKYSRIFFPMLFVCFNLLYWVLYMNISMRKDSSFVLL